MWCHCLPDWMKQVDNHRIHAGIDGALNFLSSTAHKTDVDTGERAAWIRVTPTEKNYMHNIEAYASHQWEITPRLTLSDGIRLGFSTLYSSFETAEFFPIPESGRERSETEQYDLQFQFGTELQSDQGLENSFGTFHRLSIVPNIDDVGKGIRLAAGYGGCAQPGCAPRKKTINADFNVTRFKNDRFLWETSVFGTYLFRCHYAKAVYAERKYRNRI